MTKILILSSIYLSKLKRRCSEQCLAHFLGDCSQCKKSSEIKPHLVCILYRAAGMPYTHRSTAYRWGQWSWSVFLVQISFTPTLNVKFWAISPAPTQIQEIRQSTIWYVGLLVRLDKWLINQASDVPSITFLWFLRALKILHLYFCKFIKKINWNIFSKNFARNHEKIIILGASDAWPTSHLSQQTSEPLYYIVDCRI